MAPDIILLRCDVEIAHQHDRMLFGFAYSRKTAIQLTQECELMRKFRIVIRIRKIAACGNVEIVDFESLFQNHADVAAVAVAAEFHRIRRAKGQAREDGDAVIALRTADRLMHITE